MSSTRLWVFTQLVEVWYIFGPHRVGVEYNVFAYTVYRIGKRKEKTHKMFSFCCRAIISSFHTN